MITTELTVRRDLLAFTFNQSELMTILRSALEQAMTDSSGGILSGVATPAQLKLLAKCEDVASIEIFDSTRAIDIVPVCRVKFLDTEAKHAINTAEPSGVTHKPEASECNCDTCKRYRERRRAKERRAAGYARQRRLKRRDALDVTG